MVRAAYLALALTIGTTAHAGEWGKGESDGWGKAGGAGAVAGKRLSVSDPVVVGDLALYPVIDREADGRPEVDAVPLAEAMATGRVQVRETENGTVSELVLVNRSEDPVLVMAGDVVRGGMQDRVIQRSALVAGGGVPVRLPVQCVERGRWTDRGSRTFAYAGRVDPMLRDIVATAASQDATWAAVAAANRARGVDGAASWLSGRDLDGASLVAAEQALRERFEDDKRVVGVVVARNGRFTTSEVYADPQLFARDRLQVLGAQLSAPTMVAHASEVPSADDAAAFLLAGLAD